MHLHSSPQHWAFTESEQTKQNTAPTEFSRIGPNTAKSILYISPGLLIWLFVLSTKNKSLIESWLPDDLDWSPDDKQTDEVKLSV